MNHTIFSSINTIQEQAELIKPDVFEVSHINTFYNTKPNGSLLPPLFKVLQTDLLK